MSIAVNVLSPALNATTTSSPDYGKEGHQKHIILLQVFIPNSQQYHHLEKSQQSTFLSTNFHSDKSQLRLETMYFNFPHVTLLASFTNNCHGQVHLQAFGGRYDARVHR